MVQSANDLMAFGLFVFAIALHGKAWPWWSFDSPMGDLKMAYLAIVIQVFLKARVARCACCLSSNKAFLIGAGDRRVLVQCVGFAMSSSLVLAY